MRIGPSQAAILEDLMTARASEGSIALGVPIPA